MRVKGSKTQINADDQDVDYSSKCLKNLEKGNSIQEQATVSSSLLTAMLVASIPSFQMGFAIGVLNPLTTVASTHLECSPTDMMGWPLIVSCFCPAGFLGTLLAAPTMKRGLICSLNTSCVLCILSNLLCGAAAFVPTNSGFSLLLLGRIGLGLASGIGTVVSPVYFGDISPHHLRGIIGAAYQLATVAGILISQILAVNMATPELYGYLLFSPVLVSLIQLIVSPLMLIESPVWLRANNMLVESSKATIRLGLVTAEEEDKLLKAVDQSIEEDCDVQFTNDVKNDQSVPSTLTLIQIIKDPKLGPAFFILIALQIGQQLSGINALFFYSTDFFKLAGLDNPTVGTLLASGINVLAVMCVLPLLANTARRKMLLVGLAGMLISAIVLTFSLLALDGSNEEEDSPLISQESLPPAPIDIDTIEVTKVDDVITSFVSSYIPYLALIMVLTFIIFYELSIGLVPWIVGTESFPAHAKDAAFSFASAANWFANFVIGIAFPAMQSSLGPLCFLPFIGSIVSSLLLVYYLLPETYGFSVKDNLDRMHVRWVATVGRC